MIDFKKVSMLLDGATVELTTEHEIGLRCPDCEFGVLPPFGSHYGAQTIVDTSLTKGERIAFESDSFTEAIRMKYADFYNFEHPLVADFAGGVESPR